MWCYHYLEIKTNDSQPNWCTNQSNGSATCVNQPYWRVMPATNSHKTDNPKV